MANPTCTRASLIDGGKCFANLNKKQKKAALIYFMAQELAAIGGTSYTLTAQGTLVTAAKQYLRFMPNNFENSQLVIAYNNAVAAGATPASTQATLQTAIACVENQGPLMMECMLLELLCELGRHKAYPQ